MFGFYAKKRGKYKHIVYINTNYKDCRKEKQNADDGNVAKAQHHHITASTTPHLANSISISVD